VIRWLALAFAVAASPATADGRLCLTRDVMLFGDQALGTAVTLSAIASNCGDAPFAFTEVSVHAASASSFHVASSCATGQTLAPAQSCGIGVTFAPTTTGQVSGGVWLYNTTSTRSQLVTFYGRGVDARAGGAELVFVPAPLDFGAQALGTTSSRRTLTLRNLGPSSLTFRALVVSGPAAWDFGFDAEGSCSIGQKLAAGRSCELGFTFTPAAPGARAAQLNVDAAELAQLAIVGIRGVGVTASSPAPAPALPAAIDVTEFHNAPLNHYFLTANPDEAAAIDRGAVGPDWVRTGLGFRAYAAGTTGGDAVDVCRFFGTPGVGPSSHFYTGNAQECAAVRLNPHWIDEGVAFRAVVPTAGACASGTVPVLRFFWPGSEVSQSRHRYASDADAIAALRAAAWIEEGAAICSAP